MKIFTDNAVYVQKNDIAYINSFDLSIPKSIFMKVFGNGITIINDNNRYDFVKFEENSEIEYFKNLDWIVDYNDVKDLTESEIEDMTNKIIEARDNLAFQYNKMKVEEKKKNADIVLKCDLLMFKIYSLRDFICFKRGYLKINLPEGIEYPNGYVKEKKIKKLSKRNKKK